MPDTAILPDLLSALPMPALAIDRAERIIAVNEAAQALIGHGAQGRHFVTVLRQPSLADAVEQCLADGQSRTAMHLAGEVGKEQSFEVSIRHVESTGSLVLAFQDVTHQAEAGQMRRDFVANVSHELRTPLTSLMGFIETLSGPAKDDAAARERFLSIMATEAGRMNRLVGDLLSLSRVEAEERIKPKTRINLTEILQTALRNLNPLAVDNDVRLTPLFGKEPVYLYGDADQLLQVFTNLIENGVKYGGADNAVEILSELHAHDTALRCPSVHITVVDHGPGIDPIHLPRLTQRFYRGDSHRSRALGGTGLGLAIVKHILNRHRGRLKITSEVGAGAQFRVILPRIPNAP